MASNRNPNRLSGSGLYPSRGKFGKTNLNLSKSTQLVTKMEMPEPRKRVNQPRDYHSSRPTTLLRGVHHDYMYYPVDWIERGTGKAYKKGYYDELGTYYENVVIRNGKHFETRLMCAFCGTEIKLVWDEGALPSCPNCGAAMREDFGSAVFEDEIQPVARTIRVANEPEKIRTYYSNYSSEKSWWEAWGKYAFIGLAGVAVLCLIIGLIMFEVPSKKKHKPSYSPAGVTGTYSQGGVAASHETTEPPTPTPTPTPVYYQKVKIVEDLEDTHYFSDLGKECQRDSSGRYRDDDSGCYFRLNTDKDLPVWQYWYDGISSEFEKYGWMEYNYSEGIWYIEANNNNWIPLPDKYDDSGLWHMSKSNDGRYRASDKIYVHELARNCSFNSVEHNYYDRETKCHFYYDTLSGDGYWVYFFEDLYKRTGIAWLKYDKDEMCWYAETQGRWNKLDGYNMDGVWHIETNPS